MEKQLHSTAGEKPTQKVARQQLLKAVKAQNEIFDTVSENIIDLCSFLQIFVVVVF